MNACIGIISYFPDNEHRAVRIARCAALIAKCKEVFAGLPILIVAQNWRDEIPADGITVYPYAEALSIVGARKELRKKFLESGYDWIILFDDDCALEGTSGDGLRLLQALTQNPGKYLAKDNQFKLCAISRGIYSQFDIPALSVEAGTGIEDMAYFAILARSAPQARITGFEWGGLGDGSVWMNDAATTWHRQNIPQLVRNTKAYIDGLAG